MSVKKIKHMIVIGLTLIGTSFFGGGHIYASSESEVRVIGTLGTHTKILPGVVEPEKPSPDGDNKTVPLSDNKLPRTSDVSQNLLILIGLSALLLSTILYLLYRDREEDEENLHVIAL